jgi:hypothetical protein
VFSEGTSQVCCHWINPGVPEQQVITDHQRSSGFTSYLKNRTQRTLFDGNYSEEKLIELGVPQGSAIGPLLFLLYINDLATVTQHCSVNLFADDTLIFISGKDISEIEEKMNSDLCIVSRWLRVNKLKLNLDKTKFQVVSRTSAAHLMNVCAQIDNQQLERVKVIKYLGIQIEDKLNFGENFNFVLKKMTKKINFLGRIR